MGMLAGKQGAFLREYMIDHNATRAAIRAGYSPRTARVTACKLLTKANIQFYLRDLELKAAVFAEKKADDVRRRLQQIAWTDLTDIVGFDGVKMTMKALETLTDAQRACIKKWKVKTLKKIERDTDGKPVAVDVDYVEVELHDKLKALELYAKCIGMDREARKDNIPIFNVSMVIKGQEKGPTAKNRVIPVPGQQNSELPVKALGTEAQNAR